MIFGQDRDALRKMYSDAWQKHCDGIPMSPLEIQIADVIALHPEYHDALDAADLDRDYTPEEGKTNPFLHMGLPRTSLDEPPGGNCRNPPQARQTAGRPARSGAPDD